MRDRDPDSDMAVRLYIHELLAVGPDRLTATVRCLQGPVYLHAHFHRVNDAIAIDVELALIDIYGRPVEQLDAVWTGRVTVTGMGLNRIHTGDVIHGTNQNEAAQRKPSHNS